MRTQCLLLLASPLLGDAYQLLRTAGSIQQLARRHPAIVATNEGVALQASLQKSLKSTLGEDPRRLQDYVYEETDAARPTPGKVGDLTSVCQMDALVTEAAAEGKLVVIKFWFTGCPACRAIAMNYERLARNHPEHVFVQLNLKEVSATARKFGVRSLPW